ncbi:MAG: hypothetical protein K2K75_11325 [Muribaculaceae bacterium]|nr:hypothetical protein [Muribaculaceae bacterium]
MNEDNDKIYDEDLDIEDILSPRCEFKVSSDFKDRVMTEARSIRHHRRYRWIPYLTATVAAAVVAIVIITAFHFSKTDTAAETPQITAKIENQTPTPADTIKITPQKQLLAATTQAFPEKEQVSKLIPTKKNQSRQAKSSKPIILEENLTETEPQPVTEGEMPMVNKEESLDPDEIRTRLIETRRNAEIAYIERMRDEIEANQAYISQLMTEENVYQ